MTKCLANKCDCSSELRPLAGHSSALMWDTAHCQPCTGSWSCSLRLQETSWTPRMFIHTQRSHPTRTQCQLSSHPVTRAAATAQDRELSHTTPHYFCWHLPKKFFNSIQWGKREKYWRISFWDFELLATVPGQEHTHTLWHNLTLWDSEGGKEPQKVHCWCVLSFVDFF